MKIGEFIQQLSTEQRKFLFVVIDEGGIDPETGLCLHCALGDQIEKDDPTFFARLETESRTKESRTDAATH